LKRFFHLLEFRLQKPGFVRVLGNLGLMLFLVQVLKLGLPRLLGLDDPQPEMRKAAAMKEDSFPFSLVWWLSERLPKSDPGAGAGPTGALPK
jgi:hypothetical protein